MQRTLFAFTALCALALPALAQNVVSARAGLVNYTEGAVTLRESPVSLTTKQPYIEMKDGDVVQTARGRSEVLLSPGTIMRLAEGTSVRLLSGSLTDTRLEVLDGDVLIEAAEIFEGGRLVVKLADREVEITKTGIYRFTTDPAELRVYEGRVEMPAANGKAVTAKKGAVVSMSNGLIAGKFDADLGDTFYRWASRRSSYIATANLSAAQMGRDNLLGFGFRGGWLYNPYFGMFTYIPYNGMIMSPFGYRYYTPNTIYAVYTPPPSIGGGGSAIGGMGNRMPSYNSSYGYSTVGVRGVSSAPAASMGASAPAAAASGGGARSGGDGGGRGGSASAGGRAQ